MPPSPGSRFAGLPLIDVTAPDGSTRRVVALRLARPLAATAGEHRLRQGEGLDLVARRSLGAEDLWWRVLDANPRLHPFDLRTGDMLALPARGSAGRVTRARRF